MKLRRIERGSDPGWQVGINYWASFGGYPASRLGPKVVEKMIDWARAGELRDEIGDDGFAEVFELFLDEVEEVVMRLAMAPNPATYEQDLHFLKGSAWNLGFTHFGALCQDGERRAVSGNGGAVDISAVIDSYWASKAAFIAGLDEIAKGRVPSAA